MKYYAEYGRRKHDALHPDSGNNPRFQRNTNHNDIRVVYFRRPPKNHLYTRTRLAQCIWHFCMTFHKSVHKHFAIHLQIDGQNHIHIYLLQCIHHSHMVQCNLACICFALDDERNHRHSHISREQCIFRLDIHHRKLEHIRYSLSPNYSPDYLIWGVSKIIFFRIYALKLYPIIVELSSKRVNV